MRQTLAIIGLLLLLVNAIFAHICILDPPQRGPLSINEPGDDNCFRRTPYCGGIPPQTPAVTYLAGSKTTVLFQQNLNHWYPENPGFFDLWYNTQSNPTTDISIANGWIPLANYSDYAAHDMVTQTNFTFEFQVPSQVSTHGVFVARYVSLNPFEVYPANNTDAIFYNCVDVTVVGNGDENVVEVPAKKVAPKPRSCCTPKSFSASAIETNSVGTVIHDIWYDGINQLVRWDRQGNIEEAGKSDYLITITNYTVLAGNQVNEYLIVPASNECTLYGADQFYDWCYGEVAGQEFVENVFSNGNEYSVWKQDNGFSWITEADSCAPYSVSHLNDQMVFTNFFAGPIAPSVFNIPESCNSNAVKHRSCHGPPSL